VSAISPIGGVTGPPGTKTFRASYDPRNLNGYVSSLCTYILTGLLQRPELFLRVHCLHTGAYLGSRS